MIVFRLKHAVTESCNLILTVGLNWIQTVRVTNQALKVSGVGSVSVLRCGDTLPINTAHTYTHTYFSLCTYIQEMCIRDSVVT